ncbi:hypothetical protein [Streptomyces sp. NWU339]|uniref:hypothetical protein n=1 Tax=Streptomyces sp. NWU339 TaxID=2185284 RepID=UPI0015E819E9|nr:hypothetical protein [Streptomyces sp. NWU339]
MVDDPRPYGLQCLLQPCPARLTLLPGTDAEGAQAPLDPAAAALAVADLGHRAVGSSC